MKQSFQKRYGVSSFVLTSESMKDEALGEWHQLLIRLLDRLAEHQDFEMSDFRYWHSPGLFITEGVEGRFRGKGFSVWSDLPGEIIVKYSGKYVDLFIQVINEHWLTEQTELVAD